MIAVRTPLGKFEHLAGSMEDTRTLCGLLFSVGFDLTRELNGQELPEDLCRSCAAGNARRTQRIVQGIGAT